jgi:hypothetical protein
MIPCDFILGEDSILRLNLPAVPRTFETIEFGEFPGHMFEIVGVHHSVTGGEQTATVFLMDAAVMDTRATQDATPVSRAKAKQAETVN